MEVICVEKQLNTLMELDISPSIMLESKVLAEFNPELRHDWFRRNRDSILEALAEVQGMQRKIYSGGEQSFGSGSSKSYGGGALALNCKSVKFFCLWLLDRFSNSVNIFWVGIGHGEEAILLATFFRKMNRCLHTVAMDINILLVSRYLCISLGLQNYFTFLTFTLPTQRI